MAEDDVPQPGSVPEDTEAPTPEGTAPEQVKPEKTFTQADLDKKVEQRLAKEQRKFERLLAQRESELTVKAAPPAVESKPVRREDFDSYEDYLEARAVDKATKAAERHLESVHEQQRKQAIEWSQQARQREMAQSVESLKTAGQAKYDDFDEVVEQDIPLSPAMSEAILHASNKEDLAYYFGKNPKEAEAIYELSPVLAAIAIGKLSAKLESQGTKRASSAPAPISPVGTGSVSDDTSEPSAKDPIDVWMRKREAQLAKR